MVNLRDWSFILTAKYKAWTGAPQAHQDWQLTDITEEDFSRIKKYLKVKYPEHEHRYISHLEDNYLIKGVDVHVGAGWMIILKAEKDNRGNLDALVAELDLPIHQPLHLKLPPEGQDVIKDVICRQ